ncbi:MAG: hypothetical protein AB9903_25495 [Vulcanimicrobiota bacterium]
MSFQTLINNGTIEPIPVNNDEIEAILNMGSKDLHNEYRHSLYRASH